MRSMRRREGAFTLIELMVVVIIVGILAAVAVPLYTGQVRRARATEAVAGLGAIRSAQRVYYTENGQYLAVTAGNINEEPPTGLGLDFMSNRWFDNACFSVTRVLGTEDVAASFIATATGNVEASTAPGAADVDGYVITINQEGAITYSY